ncbi:MAG TPA: hypothetical protein VK972_06845, partial [Wenzhouxiangella sp.]|nr:hypothetical protein [Wenzhouxiangella sp.]
MPGPSMQIPTLWRRFAEKRPRGLAGLTVSAILLGLSSGLAAQTPLKSVDISSDIQARIYEDASQTVT